MHHLASSNHLSNSWLQEALKIRGSINVGVGIICFPGQNRVITDLPKNWRGNYPPAPLLVYGTQILTLHTPNARPRRPFKKHQEHAFNPMRRKPFEHDCFNRSIVCTLKENTKADTIWFPSVELLYDCIMFQCMKKISYLEVLHMFRFKSLN